MRRLVILACSATKRPDPGYMPAIERYDGPLWQTLRATDPKGQLAQVAFLSAKYGFCEARRPIPPYDAVMTREKADAIIRGGMGTRWPRPALGKPDNCGDHPGMHIASMTRFGDEPFERVAFVGGELYLAVMVGLLPGFIELGGMTRSTEIALINGPIGIMRRQLRTWLTTWV